MAEHSVAPSLFVKNLVANLLPYFQAYTYPSEGALHTDVLQTLVSHGADTRAGMMHAALSIAFGFSALEALADASQRPDLSPSQRQRIRAGASSLNRACQQNAWLAVPESACDAPATPTSRVPDRPELTAEEAPVSSRPVTQPASGHPDLSDNGMTETPCQADATPDIRHPRRTAMAAAGRSTAELREAAFARLFAAAAPAPMLASISAAAATPPNPLAGLDHPATVGACRATA